METDEEFARRIAYVAGPIKLEDLSKLDEIAARYGLKRHQNVRVVVGVDPGFEPAFAKPLFWNVELKRWV